MGKAKGSGVQPILHSGIHTSQGKNLSSTDRRHDRGARATPTDSEEIRVGILTVNCKDQYKDARGSGA